MEYVRCFHCGRVSQKKVEPFTFTPAGATDAWVVSHGEKVTPEEAVAAVLSEKTLRVTCDKCQRESGKDINYVLEYTMVKPAEHIKLNVKIDKEA